MKWEDILKTTEFSLDPKVPRGRAIGRKKGTDDIQIGLPAWRESIQAYKDKREGKKYIQTEKELIQEMTRTIGHEYTHIATTDEILEEREKAWNIIKEAWKNKTDPTAGFEKYAVVNFMDEYMARVAHGERQLDVFLNRSSLQVYANGLIKIITRGIYSVATGREERYNRDWVMMPEHYEEVQGLKEFIDKAMEVIPRKYMEMATKYREKLGV